MVTFLTSSFIKYQPIDSYTPHPIDESNHFGDNLRKYWVPDSRFLFFSNDPCDTAGAEHSLQEMLDAFSLSGFSISESRCFHNQYIDDYCEKNGCNVTTAPYDALKDALQWADVIYIAGGHGPTQNTFMKKCHLRDLINDPCVFDGICIGLSAGAVNAAHEAYLLPELEGESTDPAYIRFTEGLGLTTLNIVPHLEFEQTVILDRKKLIDEIVAADSFGRDIYMIDDGSYFVLRNGLTEFFGSGLLMQNGLTQPLHSGIINADNKNFKQAAPEIFTTNVSDYYDCVLEFDKTNSRATFYYISNFLLDYEIFPVNIDTFEDLTELFIDKLIVADEKEPCRYQFQLKFILEEIEDKGCFVRTIHLDTPNGIKAASLRVKQIEGSDTRLLACFTDITMILDRDWMTDEYSRSGFIAKAESLLKQPEYSEGYSIVYANIQGFKAVNDLLGTQSGDMVIFLEKDALSQAFSPVMIARLESDHFALLTKTENITDENMDISCHQIYSQGTKRMQILIRCGVYNIDNPTKKVAHMLDQAKLAEKSIPSDHGLPYAVCNERMSQDYVNQRVFVSELDSALEKGEFIPYYQPIVDAKTGEIVSAEALIRWKHSERGMIPPGMFIPIFEKEGLTTKLDSFMVSRVLNFNIERANKGQKVVPCAVNLSRVDFYDTKLLKMLKKKLQSHANVHNLLKLEITESSYAVLESNAILFLEEMKRLNLSFLLDDFGSGMSSLSTLELYDFDTIKLDMGFIRKIGKSPKAEAIIRNTIGLAHDMGAKVVAEGVEDKEQLTFLQSVDCDMIQGYYLYKPMPEEEFAALL